jgi:NhaP-type Na+/H+ and K+/H+ antiporter
MADGSELILGIVFIVVLLSIALAWTIDHRSNRVVIDEPYEQRDTPESRYRKASGEDV